ncbi:hypothetical protein BATDEDRAFT_22828 [Batrachochytrium dendrobatidis JAM81]|uniref:CobW/HypB/UreG nucleotide-binding domain-containing protein n=1 Tax=Batrachochytrium dendrobatidis (strain JAM81 / FGSC 10211) TaxID=684364 RepID=F4NVW7_BATDJ|nr:uncharacterized protein BATDEDRAFT_22828 [Batrachochytrium dendrobatidis JAM81]EGF82726.1 hypothetical protein BATDEDRAFT_22828 [Batrachochytrium dendrobatidis JAM81]|eukprot:XP_006676640.1 hypothetical protein BATDEDRAFT_22828 [Batrachochytrium dendrobatidis JAM81]
MESAHQASKPAIPVTVLTGFLGAGKTTIILSLINKLPPNLKVALLKNEFGDVKVDSELAKENNIQVTEMTNGCICCVLVGQMKNALLEIRDTLKPDRIIIETSGSAFPAPIAWQIREMADEGFELDAIITVIDCVNFTGYQDTSYTARIQAQYTDLILLNKHDQVTERQLDLLIDVVDELNTDTPKVNVPAEGVSPSLVFGLNTHLFLSNDSLSTGIPFDINHHANEVDLIHIQQEMPLGTSSVSVSPYTQNKLEMLLKGLSKDEVYRVKGFIRLADSQPESVWIVNWAFGRSTLVASSRLTTDSASTMKSMYVLLTVMGKGLFRLRKVFEQAFPCAEVKLHLAKS